MKSIFPKLSYELFFVLFFAWSYIVGPLLGMTRHILDIGVLDIAFLDFLLLLLFIKVIPVLSRRLNFWPIGGSIVLLVVLLVAAAMSTKIETNIFVIKRVLLTCIPLFILGSCVQNYKILYRYLVNIMIVYVVLSVVSFALFGLDLGDDNSYSQQRGYNMLLPAVVLLSDTIDRFSLKCFIPFLVSVFLILAYGSRGPLVATVAFVSLYLIFSPKKQWTRSTKTSLLIFSLIVVFAIASGVGGSLSDVLGRMNMSTRTVDMINDGSLLEDNARDKLASISIQGIREYPLLGMGPVNDRNYISQFFFSGEANTAHYPHNFFLELMLQYGVVLGIVLAICFLIISYKEYRHSNDIYKSKLLLILFATFFIPLLYSGSYLQQAGLYVFIAFCINSSKLNYNK